MYVDPFWAGVFATLFVEIVLFVFLAIYSGGRKKK